MPHGHQTTQIGWVKEDPAPPQQTPLARKLAYFFKRVQEETDIEIDIFQETKCQRKQRTAAYA